MAIYTLDIEADYDFELIGLSSHENDYRLAWSLNRSMNWKLIRHEDVLSGNKKVETWHAQFRYVNTSDHSVITLIDNKTADGLFIQELAQLDYIIKIENAREDFDDSFYRKLRKTPFVVTAYPLEVAKLKSKRNLLFENR